MQAGAGDDIFRFEIRRPRSRQSRRRFAAGCLSRCAWQTICPPASVDPLRQSAADRRIIDDSRFGHVDRFDCRRRAAPTPPAVRDRSSRTSRRWPARARRMRSSAGSSASSSRQSPCRKFRTAIPSAAQNCSIASFPVRQFCARSEPGLVNARVQHAGVAAGLMQSPVPALFPDSTTLRAGILRA